MRRGRPDSGYVKENRHVRVPVTNGYSRRQTGTENAPGFRPMRMISMRCESVYIVTYHVFVIDKQIVIAVETIPVLLAEARRHVAIVPRLTP